MGGFPIGRARPGAGGGPIGQGTAGLPRQRLTPGGPLVERAGIFSAAPPIGGPIVRVFPGGAPVATLGGVFAAGLPIGGPLTQIYRGGSAPQPPTLFFSTISGGGPIGGFLMGFAGGPIGVDVFGGGGLPIGQTAQEARIETSLQARTAFVGAEPFIPAASGAAVSPAVAFG